MNKKNLYGNWQCLLDHIDYEQRDSRLDWTEITIHTEDSSTVHLET